MPHSFSLHYLRIVKEEFKLERELERVEKNCERETGRVRAKLGEPWLIHCFSIEPIKGNVDSVRAFVATTSDLHATFFFRFGSIYSFS